MVGLGGEAAAEQRRREHGEESVGNSRLKMVIVYISVLFAFSIGKKKSIKKKEKLGPFKYYWPIYEI